MPEGAESWLSPPEWLDYRLQGPRSAACWLLGRALGKQLVRDTLRLDASVSELSIFSRDGMGRRARPRVFLRGRALECSLSISHADGLVLVGLATQPGLIAGVDVAMPFRPTGGFLDLFFTANERALVEAGSCDVASLWTVKEAAYKALNRANAFDPLGVEVCPLSPRDMSFGEIDGTDRPRHGVAGLLTIGSAIGALAVWQPA